MIVKTFSIVIIVFVAAVLGGLFYIGSSDVKVKQTEKIVELPYPTKTSK